MSERFEICAGERIRMIAIKDKQTKEMGLGLFKSKDDLSFLEAIRDAAQELLDTLKADTSNDTDGAEDTEPEQEEKKQPVPYNGTVEVVKGDNKLFPTGLKLKVIQGKVAYITGNLVNDISAYIIFCNNTFKSFDDLSKFFDKMHIEIKEGEE